jgi:butyrate kinase
MKRKVIQIAPVTFMTGEATLHALCDEGTIWVLSGKEEMKKTQSG